MYLFRKKTILIVFILSCFTGLAQEEKPKLELGGALRFNYNYSSWKEGQQKRGGDFGFDVFRINAKSTYKEWVFNAEYRFYSSDFGGSMLKQGWISRSWGEHNQIQFGLTQVPFGVTPYNSHSWFFGMNYYVGLEDDHDMGIKWMHQNERWDFALAFFKNAEELRFGSNSDVSDSRYAYDVGSSADGEFRNKEVNQLNGRVAYRLDDAGMHQLGASAQYGGLYNLDTEDMGDHYALAVHYALQSKRWNLKAQWSHYQYNAESPEEESKDLIAMTAYGAPYMVASEASVYTVGLSYQIPVNWGLISSLQFYNDFGMLDKTNKNFEDAMMNVTGALLTVGSSYVYIDYALGKNQPWIGPEWSQGLAAGNPEADWESRFNINFGYYF